MAGIKSGLLLTPPNRERGGKSLKSSAAGMWVVRYPQETPSDVWCWVTNMGLPAKRGRGAAVLGWDAGRGTPWLSALRGAEKKGIPGSVALCRRGCNVAECPALGTSPGWPRARCRGAQELGSAQLPAAARERSSAQDKLDRLKARASWPGYPHVAASVCVRVCTRVRVCLCVCACMCVHVCVTQPAQRGAQFQRGRGRESCVARQEPFKEKDLGSANDLTLQRI